MFDLGGSESVNLVSADGVAINASDRDDIGL